MPFTPGTGIDLIERTVGPQLSERLGRPVVVDNRAGAYWFDLAGDGQHTGHERQPVPTTRV